MGCIVRGRENVGFQMGRFLSHSVYSLKWFCPTPSCLYYLKISLFAKKALRYIQKWGGVMDPTFTPKTPWCCCWWDWCPRQVPAEILACCLPKEVLKLGAFPKPCPYPSLQWDMLPISGLISKSLKLAYSMFSNEIIHFSFIQEANFLSAYTRLTAIGWVQCSYSMGLWAHWF